MARRIHRCGQATLLVVDLSGDTVARKLRRQIVTFEGEASPGFEVLRGHLSVSFLVLRTDG